MPTIILHKSWKLKSTGVEKRPGTEITFAHGSPEIQEILEAEAGTIKAALPVDLPGKEHFEKAGFDSLQGLATLERWDQVKGIGTKTAEELDNYFTKINEEE